MSVDTEQQHYECTKCHDVVSISNYARSKNNQCSKGGRCDWKKNQTSFNKSALGATINMGVGLAKWGVDKAKSKSDKDSSENQEHSSSKSDSLSEEEKQLKEQERIRLKAEKEAKSAEENKKIIAFLKKYWWIVLVLVGLLGARIIYMRMSKKTTPISENVTSSNSTVSPQLNSNETAASESKEEVVSDNTIPAATINYEGTWKGSFGKDELTIVIESIDANGVVKGYDEVKGNRRTLKGNLIESDNENQLILNEPGDDKWDGEFKMNYDKSSEKLIGEWNSNNGKMKKEFNLIKNK
jgi:hypothetical protein